MTEDNQTSFVDQLVETKSNEKFRDPEFLAKTKLDSDKYVNELQEKVQSLESTVANLRSQEEIEKAIEEKAKAIAEMTKPTEPAPQANPEAEDIESLVDQAVTRREQQAREVANKAEVDSFLREKFGTAENAVAALATLGLDTETLKTLSVQNPQAVKLLFNGANVPTKQPVTSEVNSQSLVSTQTEVKNNSYYEKLRKEDPKKYWSKSVQIELHDSASKLGSAFFQT